MEVAVTALIRAVGQAFQAAASSPFFSTTLGSTATGGLLQSPVPTHGNVLCSSTTTMSTGTPAIESSAFLLVASGIIKVCVHRFS
jgi:hypothetical protein